MFRIQLLLVISLFLLVPPNAHSLSVTKYPDQSATLIDRWEWAKQNVPKKEVWIAYSIQQSMPENEIIGSFYGGHERFPTIYEILTGNKRTFRPNMRNIGDGQFFGKAQLTSTQGRGEIVSREIAILFGFSGNRMDRVEVSMIDLQFNFRKRDLLWLGAATQEQSINFLQNFYKKQTDTKMTEDLLDAIGIHRSPALVVPFLKEILNSHANDDLRAKAAFWLGNQNDPAALKVLVEVIGSEK